MKLLLDENFPLPLYHKLRAAGLHPIQRRAEIWAKAIEDFLTRKPSGKLFELLDSGEVAACKTRGPLTR